MRHLAPLALALSLSAAAASAEVPDVVADTELRRGVPLDGETCSEPVGGAGA